MLGYLRWNWNWIEIWIRDHSLFFLEEETMWLSLSYTKVVSGSLLMLLSSVYLLHYLLLCGVFSWIQFANRFSKRGHWLTAAIASCRATFAPCHRRSHQFQHSNSKPSVRLFLIHTYYHLWYDSCVSLQTAWPACAQPPKSKASTISNVTSYWLLCFDLLLFYWPIRKVSNSAI